MMCLMTLLFSQDEKQIFKLLLGLASFAQRQLCLSQQHLAVHGVRVLVAQLSLETSVKPDSGNAGSVAYPTW